MDLYSLEDALNLAEKEVKDMYKSYVNPGLASIMGLINFDRTYNYALGSIVKDREGKEYLDFLGGYGALNMGHNHPAVTAAYEKVKSYPNILQASLGTFAAVLAKNLAAITPGNLQRSFFGNSGAEAVEGALKLARIASRKTKIIYCDGSFHGKTYGALSVTGRDKYKEKFQPVVPQCYSVPFGDIDCLQKQLMKRDVAAFIVECIQGEGGINVPPAGYLPAVRELCSKYEALLIVDEIQTGLGRTGKMFACEHENIVPDIMCIAKSLGGGVAPLGAYITTEKIHNAAYGSPERALLHTSTFGGNTYACAAGIAALQVIINEDLAGQAKEKGDYLLERLKGLQTKYPIIKDVRGKGLMIGIELQGSGNRILNRLTGGTIENLSNEYFASLVAGKLLNDYRIITAYTLNNPNVIRIEPPLNIEKEYLDKLIYSLEEIFNANQSFIKLAFSNIKNIF
ncbi:MAG: aspartate aminotransferase family protein [Peptococcaceae bacterium]